MGPWEFGAAGVPFRTRWNLNTHHRCHTKSGAELEESPGVAGRGTGTGAGGVAPRGRQVGDGRPGSRIEAHDACCGRRHGGCARIDGGSWRPIRMSWGGTFGGLETGCVCSTLPAHADRSTIPPRPRRPRPSHRHPPEPHPCHLPPFTSRFVDRAGCGLMFSLAAGRGRNAPEKQRADVAQLVAHHLAKVRVAGSNPVIRSKANPALVGGVAEW